MLAIGDPFPAFALADQTGRTVRSGDFAGKPYVVYFYPKDDTPGCTVEACAFRDASADYAAAGAAVLGVSADDPASHAKFAAKFALGFTLLADPDKTLIGACGAWGEKKMYGKTYLGIVRSTFVVGADGRVAAVFPKVTPEGHAAEVLAAVRAAAGPTA
jgi:peroxiredoxin Q/BCP